MTERELVRERETAPPQVSTRAPEAIDQERVAAGPEIPVEVMRAGPKGDRSQIEAAFLRWQASAGNAALSAMTEDWTAEQPAASPAGPATEQAAAARAEQQVAKQVAPVAPTATQRPGVEETTATLAQKAPARSLPPSGVALAGRGVPAQVLSSSAADRRGEPEPEPTTEAESPEGHAAGGTPGSAGPAGAGATPPGEELATGTMGSVGRAAASAVAATTPAPDLRQAAAAVHARRPETQPPTGAMGSVGRAAGEAVAGAGSSAGAMGSVGRAAGEAVAGVGATASRTELPRPVSTGFEERGRVGGASMRTASGANATPRSGTGPTKQLGGGPAAGTDATKGVGGAAADATKGVGGAAGGATKGVGSAAGGATKQVGGAGGTKQVGGAGGAKQVGGAGGTKQVGGAGGTKAGGAAGGGGGTGDATLDKWKAASKAAIDANPDGDLGDAKDGPKAVKEGAKAVDSARKAGATDYEADAKAQTPKMPEEPPKEQVLDTAPAEAAIDAIKQKGKRKLSDQTFDPLGAPPAYPGLNPRDYVPATLLDKVAQLEAELKKETDPGKQAELTKQLEAAKKRVSQIEEAAAKGAPIEPPPTVVDQGAASLDPIDPAQADLLGDGIARALNQSDETAASITTAAVTRMKGDRVRKALDLANTEKPDVKDELERELRGIAEAAGVTEEQLKAKVTEQKDVVKKEKKELDEKVQSESTEGGKQVEERGKDESEQIAGAKKAVSKEVQAKKDAVSGPPDTEAIEAKRDELLGKATEMGAAASAAITAALTKRETELDTAGTSQKQKAKSAADNQAAAIRRHWAADTDPNKGMVEARPTVSWGTNRSTQVDTEVRTKKADAKKQADGYSDEIALEVTTAKEAIRDWAASKEGRERSWWERLWDMITDWGDQAEANNAAWERQRNAESRDAMVKDFDAITKLKEAANARNGEAMNAELSKMDDAQKALADQFLKGGISSIEFVAQSTIQRITKRRVPELASDFEKTAIAEWNWEDLAQLAKASNPGYDPATLGNQIKGAIAGAGTNEAAVFAALGQARTAVERASLEKFYLSTFKVSMAEDIRDDMGGRELERAEALMSGDRSGADAAALAEAIEGWGTDEQAIKDALRGKSPEEIAAIKAAYLQKTGRPLSTDLEEDLSGAAYDNAFALINGDSDLADAAELEEAMEGAGTDEAGLKKVYERIRQEEEARARAEGLTPAELDARIKERNARLKTAYELRYGSLEKNLEGELSDAERGLMAALQSGDARKIDAAKANVEHESWSTSDDELEKIVRNQHRDADLKVSMELAAEKARIRALKESGDLSPKEEAKLLAQLAEREKNKDAAVKAQAQKNMTDLKTEYGKANVDGQSFDKLILEETSGYSQLELQDLVAAGGALSPEDEIFYATAGAGTDEDTIKSSLAGKTPAEIAKIREAYENKHGVGSFDNDILGDLSGRDDFDVGQTLRYGDPSTFARQLEEAKTPAERARLLEEMNAMLQARTDFEKSGLIGSLMADGLDPMNTADQLARAVRRAEDYNNALNEADAKGLTPEQRAKDPDLVGAKANFEMNVAGTVEAQEQVRKQIDSYTDAAATVGAVVVGVAITILTAGAGATLLAAAVYGAIASAAATMALKAGLKGAAYGWEDAGVDAAVGAVDAAVTAATFGVGKAITTAVQKAIMSTIAKQALKEGAEEIAESAAKKFLQEAVEEALENAISGIPSAVVEAAMNDDTWKGGDPLGAIGNAAGMAAAMGAGMGVGMKGAGDAVGGIKGKLKGEPTVDVGAKTGSPDAGATGPTSTTPKELPEPPEIELPDPADPAKVVDAAAKGEAPAGTSAADFEAKTGAGEGDLGPGSKPDAEADAAAKADADAEARADAATKAEAEGGPGAKAGGEAEAPVVVTPGQGADVPAVTPVDAGPKAGKPSADDVGKPLSQDDLRTRYGMPEENVKKITDIASNHGVVIDIRPTTPHAAPMLEAGTALPKPEKLKAKTINDVDVAMGLAKPEDLGKVGFFRPAQIDTDRDLSKFSPEMREKITERVKQRLEEVIEYWPDMQKLMDAGKIRIEPNGIVINTGLTPGGKEIPFTGDHDLFDVRFKDGTKVPREKYQQVIADLKAADCGVEHGSVTGWELDAPGTFNTPAGQQSYGKMVGDHSPGGKEPLVRIGDGEPTATWYHPAAEAPTGTAPAITDQDIDEWMAGFDQRVIAPDPNVKPPPTEPDVPTTGAEPGAAGVGGSPSIKGALEAEPVIHGPDTPATGTTPKVEASPDVDAGVTPVEPGATVGKPSLDDVGKPLSATDLAERYGMPIDNVNKINGVAMHHEVVIDVRPTTANAAPMLEAGTALPKPEKLKVKTISQTDVDIGLARPEDIGKVGYFPGKEGRRPEHYDSLPDHEKAAIDKRIAQRKEESTAYGKDMTDLEAKGKIRVDPATGLVINTGLTPGGEKPFTGDHDLFDIRNRDGTPVSREKYLQVVADLKAAECGVMHGSVLGWELDAPETFHTPQGQKAFGGYLAEHSTGGKEPLVRIGAGEPHAALWEPPATSAGGATAPTSTSVVDQAEALVADESLDPVLRNLVQRELNQFHAEHGLDVAAAPAEALEGLERRLLELLGG